MKTETDDDDDDDRSASALDLLGSAGAGEFSEAFYAAAGAGRQALYFYFTCFQDFIHCKWLCNAHQAASSIFEKMNCLLPPDF